MGPTKNEVQPQVLAKQFFHASQLAFCIFTLHSSLSTPSPSLQLTASNSSPPTTQKAPILRPTANNSSPLHHSQQQQPLRM